MLLCAVAESGFFRHDPARRDDPAWWLRFQVAIREVERRRALETLQARLSSLQTRMLCSAILTQLYEDKQAELKHLDELGKITEKLVDAIEDQHQPWSRRQRRKARLEQVKGWRQAWEETFGGKLDSPEMQARIDATVAALQDIESARQKQLRLWKQRKAEEARKCPPATF